MWIISHDNMKKEVIRICDNYTKSSQHTNSTGWTRTEIRWSNKNGPEKKRPK